MQCGPHKSFECFGLCLSQVWMYSRLYRTMDRFHKPEILEAAKAGTCVNTKFYSASLICWVRTSPVPLPRTAGIYQNLHSFVSVKIFSHSTRIQSGVVPVPIPVSESAADTTENASMGLSEYTSLYTNQIYY